MYNAHKSAGTDSFHLGEDGIAYSPIPLSFFSEIMDISERDGDIVLHCFIHSKEGFNNFEKYGIHPTTRSNPVSTAFLTLDQIDSLRLDTNVLRITPGMICQPALDTSLLATGVTDVQNYLNLDGSGVIVGVIEHGFDVYNLDFTETVDSTKTRILYAVDACDSTSPPFALGGTYGKEYNKQDIEMGIYPYATDTAGHGTHVTGIACGNGRKTKRGVPSGTFKGVAHEANIVAVNFEDRSRYTASRIYDAAWYITNKADSLGMPCVINMSVASLYGPKDGTSPYELGMSQLRYQFPSPLTKILVVAAGNQNYAGVKTGIGGYMQKLCIFAFLMFLFIIVQFCSADSEDGQDTKAVKTGDVEVFAYGCDPPPYPHGLKLILVKMPKRKPVEIPNWIGPMPKAGEGIGDWYSKLRDSLGDSFEMVLGYIYDSLGVGYYPKKTAEFYFELVDSIFAEGITDTSGYYVFKDVPVGRYEIVCNRFSIPTERPDFDSLKKALEAKGVDSSKIRHPGLPYTLPVPGVETDLSRRDQMIQTWCVPGHLDFLRVAQDSIIIVHISMRLEDDLDMYSSKGIAYIQGYKPRGCENEDRK